MSLWRKVCFCNEGIAHLLHAIFACFGENNYKPIKRGKINLEMRSIGGKALILFFVLAIAMPLMCIATREDVSEPNIYQIDYNGPQTHALPPPGSTVGKGSMPNHSGVKNTGKQKKPIHA
ncbi:uncharacterized protein LOC144573352 [Carex rostrata]